MTSSGRPYMTNSDGLTVGQAIVRARETACIPARAGKHLNISCSTSRPDRGVDVPHHYFERCGRDRPQNGARDSRPGVVYNLRQTLAGIWIVGPCPNTKNTALGALLMQAELCETSRNPDLRARRNSLLLIREFAFLLLKFWRIACGDRALPRCARSSRRSRLAPSGRRSLAHFHLSSRVRAVSSDNAEFTTGPWRAEPQTGACRILRVSLRVGSSVTLIGGRRHGETCIQRLHRYQA